MILIELIVNDLIFLDKYFIKYALIYVNIYLDFKYSSNFVNISFIYLYFYKL